MNTITMDNRTNKNISSRNKRKRIFQNVLMIFNILLLAAAVVIAAMVLTGCSKEPETFPEAEAAVASALDDIQSGKSGSATMPELANGVEDDNASLTTYVEKVREFEYEILASHRIEDTDQVAVITRIKTYDFGSVYTKAWLEYLAVEDIIVAANEFDLNLLYRLASVSSKDYGEDVEIICTDSGDGNWKAEIESNDKLMNALSGGMVEAIKMIAAESDKKDD